ncbi:MAG TPA: hypothetical protein VFZ98_14335 [Vicinamibacterales bacterium]
MIRRRTHHLLVVTLVAFAVVTWFRAAPFASGPIGIYALIDKVVLEPNDTAPDHAQIWGVFVIADRQRGTAVFPAKRGYLYFQLPEEGVWRDGVPRSEVTRREWNDLKAVAGTGQMVGFGSSWVGNGTGSPGDPYRVRPASESPAAPNPYVLNTGVVKLPAGGSNEEILNQLRAAHDR